MGKANEVQIGGSHYKAHGSADMQHWDVVKIFNLDYFQGNITKYVFRWRDKKGIEDLKKARHYLDKYIEMQEQEAADRTVQLNDEGIITGPKDVTPEMLRAMVETAWDAHRDRDSNAHGDDVDESRAVAQSGPPCILCGAWFGHEHRDGCDRKPARTLIYKGPDAPFALAP